VFVIKQICRCSLRKNNLQNFIDNFSVRELYVIKQVFHRLYDSLVPTPFFDEHLRIFKTALSGIFKHFKVLFYFVYFDFCNKASELLYCIVLITKHIFHELCRGPGLEAQLCLSKSGLHDEMRIHVTILAATSSDARPSS